jgi:hypothetical protein
MLTAGINALALARIEAIQLLHGQCDGLLLIGLATASSTILTIAQPRPAKAALRVATP